MRRFRIYASVLGVVALAMVAMYVGETQAGAAKRDYWQSNDGEWVLKRGKVHKGDPFFGGGFEEWEVTRKGFEDKNNLTWQTKKETKARVILDVNRRDGYQTVITLDERNAHYSFINPDGKEKVWDKPGTWK